MPLAVPGVRQRSRRPSALTLASEGRPDNVESWSGKRRVLEAAEAMRATREPVAEHTHHRAPTCGPRRRGQLAHARIRVGLVPQRLAQRLEVTAARVLKAAAVVLLAVERHLEQAGGRGATAREAVVTEANAAVSEIDAFFASPSRVWSTAGDWQRSTVPSGLVVAGVRTTRGRSDSDSQSR